MKLAALVILLFLQDLTAEQEILRIAERLRDDRIEVRHAALQELVALGPKALDSIRRRAASEPLEVRDRLLAAASEIERLERVNPFRGRVHRVSLRADRKPLRQIAAEIQRQASTQVSVEVEIADDPVTLDLAEVPFFEALDRLCRVHGRVVMRLPFGSGSRDLGPVTLHRGDPRAARIFIDDQFIVKLHSVRWWDTWDFRESRKGHMEIVVQWGWEPDTRPMGIRFRVDSIVDEEGRSYKLSGPKNGNVEFDSGLNRHEQLTLEHAPPPSVGTFREIRGILEVELPSDAFRARLGRPLGKKDVKVDGGPASFTLREFVREEDGYRVVVDAPFVFGERDPQKIQFEILDADGKVYLPARARGRGSEPGFMTYTLHFDVRAGVDIEEIRAVRLVGESGRTMTRRIAWKFEGVQFR